MKQVFCVSVLSLALAVPAYADVGEAAKSNKGSSNATEAVKPAPEGSTAATNAPTSAQPPTSDRTPEKATPTPLTQSDSLSGETSDRTPEKSETQTK